MRLVIVFLFSYFNVFSQVENQHMISMPNMNVIFTGFDNLIHVAASKRQMKKIQLECLTCDNLRRIPNTSQWLVRLDSIKPVLLQVKNQSGKVLSELNVLVNEPPKPFIHLNDKFAFEKVREVPSTITLKIYGPVPLSIVYTIKKWSFKVGGEVYEGRGSKISKELQEALISIKSGIVTVQVVYMDPFGENELTEYINFEIQ